MGSDPNTVQLAIDGNVIYAKFNDKVGSIRGIE